MNGSRLRVLQVSARYYPFMGGVETHVHEVAGRLARRGVRVTILTTDPRGTLPPQETVGGVEVRRVRAWPSSKDYHLAPGVLRTILAEPWDVVHCQGVHTLVAPAAMLAARLAQAPYVLTFHTGGHPSRLRSSLRSLQWQALRPLLCGAAALVAVSRFEQRLFTRQLGLEPGRVMVIPNGASVPEQPPELSAPVGDGMPAGGPLVVSVGRLERYKGHHRVLAALPHLRAACPEARLLILGAGPYEAALRAQARDLGVQDAVEIRAIPPAERAELAATLVRAAVVTLLSEYEAHPVAVMEAVALGRPVLVADTSGLSELAEDGIARAIPLASPPARVAAALLSQIRDPLLPRGIDLPTWDDTADRLLALYRGIAGRSIQPCAS